MLPSSIFTGERLEITERLLLEYDSPRNSIQCADNQKDNGDCRYAKNEGYEGKDAKNSRHTPQDQ